MATHQDKVLKLIRKAGILRARELAKHNIPGAALIRLEKKGQIRRISRGLYERTDRDPTEHIDLMEVCKRVPQGVVCLISALNFHQMTTQMPYEVWLAIGVRAHRPRIDQPPTRIVRFSGQALIFGVEHHVREGVEFRVTSPAKTVADCFKYRKKIGTDVATEALKEFLRKRKGKRDELWHAAQVCRVTKVIQPYLEALS